MCLEFGQGLAIKMVAAGAEHTVAVSEDGKLYGWGWGRYGNLGLADRNDRFIPEEVAAMNVGELICLKKDSHCILIKQASKIIYLF